MRPSVAIFSKVILELVVSSILIFCVQSRVVVWLVCRLLSIGLDVPGGFRNA